MANRWQDLLSAYDEMLREAFLESIYRIRDEADISAIVGMLARGDIDGAVRAAGLDPAQFRPLDRALADAYEAGGEFTSKLFPAARENGIAVIARFNVRNPTAENWLRNYSATLIREISDDQRAMIRDAVTAAMEIGQSPRATALDLVGRVNRQTGRREGGLIGLTAYQEQILRNYERELNAASPAEMARAIDRKLRDKRFDSAVRRAIENEEAIPSVIREKMIVAYRNRALRSRAELIAQSESSTALHAAQQESVDQAIASGAVKPSVVSYIWRDSRDNRVRDTHRAMNGQRCAHGQTFKSPSGARLRYPGDPRAPIAETARCRCWREIDIDFLAD